MLSKEDLHHIQTSVRTVVREEVAEIKKNVEDIIETQQFLVSKMVTHEEMEDCLANLDHRLTGVVESGLSGLRVEINKAKQEAMDHTSRECAKLRGDMIVLHRKADLRTDVLTTILHEKNVLTDEEKTVIQRYSPFPAHHGI